MELALCQLDIVWEDKPANYARVRTMLAESSIQPGALVALPEMFATGFSMHVSTIAEPDGGPTHAFLAELARERQIFLVGGMVTRAPDGRGRNEAVVFGPDGQTLAHYSKMYPFTLAGEKKYYEAGTELTTFRCHDFTVAPFICYDLRFPEIFRVAVRRNAELMLVIANWPKPREPHWLALLRARAIENQCYVAGVNRWGDDPHIHYGGRSIVFDPRGETVAEAGAGPEVLAARIDRQPLVDYRREFPALADIRGELFS